MPDVTPERVPLVIGRHPYVIVEAIPTDVGGTDMKIQADGYHSPDEVVVALLTAVEGMTGVSTDQYVQTVDIIRTAAKGQGSPD